VTTVDSSAIITKGDLKGEEISVLAGGPPCRGFSTSNRKNRNLQNPLNQLYQQFFRLVADLSPRMFLLENVEGLCSLANGLVQKDILEIGHKLGYQTNYWLVKSENFGVPQRRKRVLFIGSKTKEFKLAKDEVKGQVTVRQAIDDLPSLQNGNTIDELPYRKNTCLSDYQKNMRSKYDKCIVKNNMVTKNGELALTRYKLIPQGGNWRNLPPSLMSNYKNLENCHGWIYHRLEWGEPSIVIGNFRKNMLIHPEENRGLSVREAARLQSFPDNYIFYGKLGAQQQQIANAVPPLVAKAVGLQLKCALED
jgi:DNA (cytosine-5)-methyltransferase 1